MQRASCALTHTEATMAKPGHRAADQRRRRVKQIAQPTEEEVHELFRKIAQRRLGARLIVQGPLANGLSHNTYVITWRDADGRDLALPHQEIIKLLA